MRVLVYMNDGYFNFISTYIEAHELYNDLLDYHTTKHILFA